MAAARGEVVGADDAGPAVDAAPAADMVGRREVGDVARRRRSSRSPARLPISRKLPGSSSRSMRSRQVSLPRLRWRTTPGSFEPGASRAWAIACRAATSSSIGAQLSSAVTARRGPGGAGRRRDDGQDLPALDRVADGSAAPGSSTTPAQGAVTDGLHLHGADDHQQVAGLHRGCPRATLISTTEPAMRAFDGLVLPVGTGSGRAGGAVGGAACRGRALRPAGRGTAAAPAASPSAASDRMLGEQGGARVARADTRDAPGWRAAGRGWSARPRCGTRRARARVRSTAESKRARGARLADQLGEHRIELRRRRQADVAAGIDAHAGPRRLLVGGERAGAAARRRAPARHSRAAGRPPSGRRGPASASDAPAAMRNCASTRSKPVTCSVTVCSTWMRGLHSMKKCSPRLGIDQELDGAGVHVARRRGPA